MCLSKQLAQLAMLILLALLLMCFRAGNVYCVHENSTDLHSLLDFKQDVTSDPNRALSSWNTNAHYCRWKYVTCTQTRPWRVSGLNLTGQSLEGQISSSLANLTFLSVIDLSVNNFFGELPPLNGLQQLDTLYLNGNSLEGNIPDTLTNFSKLKNLDLSHNQLSGTIPPKIGSLSNLEVLLLGHNNLTGIIPPTFSNLTSLSICNFVENQLEGSIPHGIWQSSNMTVLALGSNSLSGEIPQSINMSRLQILGLELNKLSKVLPSNIGDALPNLQRLMLGGNTFVGQIPASLGNTSGLQVIDLSINSFTGLVPASLGKLSNLNELNLETNKLEAEDRQSWEFLHALRNCGSLNLLSLYDNRLQGDIPDSVGTLSTTLEYLSFGGNELTGIVPPTIGNLHNLVKLGLEENSLSGAPEEWIGKLKKLQGLFLSGNNFTGSIPSSIGYLSQLTLLFLDRNEFEGPIPLSIENLVQLSVMNLSYNNFQGYIPLGLGNLKQLIQLDLSSNKFTGEIPYGLAQCQNLETIEMDKNFLIGDIPATLGDIKGLILLNLSHNNLSGSIPITLNYLSILNKLDLSYNNLQGELPQNGVLADPTVVSLYGNRGLCGGGVILHMPSCPTVSHRIGKQYYLARVLIPIFGFMSLVLWLVYLLFLVKKTPKINISPTSFRQDFLKVSYNDLARATRNFSESNLVGRGSYGSVYRGKLKENKTEVAVKVFNLEMQGAEKSFMSECEALRRIEHRNVLPIITACSSINNNGDAFKALVYEYMPNGNLDIWLHPNGEAKAPNKRLGLTQRISIAVNIADALDYLHHDCGRPTIHCDVKPSNILLDVYMTALLGDFGIAKFYDDSSSTSTCSVSIIGLKYTIGYIPPE
ncbi:receptor kinase-like protein Xa21 [Phragmites australis]|uniref:receptor kinase-like protein Xa21 n=1 Tax=Phragmites australis TaxID=29695 RepID=UPI002D76FE99|nr:receptor kinase-like protein Xa21 [Phragmites australis]